MPSLIAPLDVFNFKPYAFMKCFMKTFEQVCLQKRKVTGIFNRFATTIWRMQCLRFYFRWLIRTEYNVPYRFSRLISIREIVQFFVSSSSVQVVAIHEFNHIKMYSELFQYIGRPICDRTLFYKSGEKLKTYIDCFMTKSFEHHCNGSFEVRTIKVIINSRGPGVLSKTKYFKPLLRRSEKLIWYRVH